VTHHLFAGWKPASPSPTARGVVRYAGNGFAFVHLDVPHERIWDVFVPDTRAVYFSAAAVRGARVGVRFHAALYKGKPSLTATHAMSEADADAADALRRQTYEEWAQRAGSPPADATDELTAISSNAATAAFSAGDVAAGWEAIDRTARAVKLGALEAENDCPHWDAE